MRIEFSNGATAHIINVYVGNSKTNTSKLVGGPYYSTTSDSVISPDGIDVQITAQGSNPDSVALIDQTGNHSEGKLDSNVMLLGLSNFVSKDSFTIRVYR